MVTGEKVDEFRKPSDWIRSRLFHKDGSLKHYDVVKYTNGYGKDKPTFTCKYNGCYVATVDEEHTYSNGLTVAVQEGDFIIMNGDVLN